MKSKFKKIPTFYTFNKETHEPEIVERYVDIKRLVYFEFEKYYNKDYINFVLDGSQSNHVTTLSKEDFVKTFEIKNKVIFK